MSRQALGQAARTVVRRVGLGVLLGIAGAFAFTVLSWMASSVAASADEEPAAPLVNVVGSDDPIGLVNNAVDHTVETVTTQVLPPRSQPKASPIVGDSFDQALGHVEKTVGALERGTQQRPVHASAAVRQPAAPVIVPSPPPDKHVVNPPVHRPPVPVRPSAPVRNAAPVADPHLSVPVEHQPEGPAAPAPSSQWNVPSAPAPGGSPGSGFHAPETPAFEGSASPFWTGRTVYRPLRSLGPVVFRTVNAQPGVTPD